MNNLLKLIVFFMVIFIFLYLIYRKKYLECFLAPIINFDDKLEFKIDVSDSLLWLNNDLNNIKKLEDFSGFQIKDTSYPYYTNLSILNSSSYYQGIFIKMYPNKPLKNIRIGLHHTKLSKLNDEMSDLDFCIKFNEDNSINIMEKNNPIIDFNYDQDKKNINTIQNLDFCSSGIQKECQLSTNKYKYSEDDNFGIIIFNGIVHYLIIKEEYNNTFTKIKGYQGILIHKSKNFPIYPIFPCILSDDNNLLTKINWLVSTTESPSEYSIEYQSENHYKELPLPDKKPLYDLTPAPSIPEAPSFEDDFDYSKLPPWDRRILLLNGIVRDNKILNLYLQVFNINQEFLDRMFGVTIILSNDVSERKLNVPLIPYIQKEKLIMGDENDIIINLDISNSISFFYKKNINVEVLFRFGQFTTEGNILSNSFKIKF